MFAAVWPPEEVRAALRGVPRPAAGRLRWVPEPQWHVTVAFFGEVADPAPLSDALAAAAASVPGPLAVALGPAVERLGRHVLCVPVGGLEPLAAAVGREAAAWTRPEEGRPFQGHLTLARGKGRAPVPPAAAGSLVRAAWTVDALSLVRSDTADGGVRYREMGCHRLGGPTMRGSEDGRPGGH